MGMTKKRDAVEISIADLQEAYDGSFYTICGAGGDLQEWVHGYGDMMQEALIERPTRWVQTTGAAVNQFAQRKASSGLFPTVVSERDQFQSDLTILLFPLDGLHVGRLAMFKLQMQDRWFDDVIDNMVRA